MIQKIKSKPKNKEKMKIVILQKGKSLTNEYRSKSQRVISDALH